MYLITFGPRFSPRVESCVSLKRGGVRSAPILFSCSYLVKPARWAAEGQSLAQSGLRLGLYEARPFAGGRSAGSSIFSRSIPWLMLVWSNDPSQLRISRHFFVIFVDCGFATGLPDMPCIQSNTRCWFQR